MKIAITQGQREKLADHLDFACQHQSRFLAALQVAVQQNSIFSYEEQWVLPTFVQAWATEESGVADFDCPLTPQHIQAFLAKFVVIAEDTR